MPENPEPTTLRRLPIGWPGLAVLGLAAAVVVALHTFAIPLSNPFYGLFKNYVDLAIYRAGGDTMLHGRGLYAGPVLYGMEFTYTPFAAILFVPFAALSQSVANLVWWLAILLALALTIVLSFKSLGYQVTRRLQLASALLAVVVTWFEPVRTTIWLAQINIFLMLLVVWDLTRPEGSRLKGIGVGIAAGIKLTPGFFLFYLAVTRQWRSFVSAVGALAATIVIGFIAIPGDSWAYWTGTFRNSERIGPVDAPSNQSINGFLGQMLRVYDVTRYANPANAGVFEPPRWMWLLCAVPAAALGLAAARLAHRRGRELLALVLTGMTATTVSPFSWDHHWVWFVPLFVLTLHYAFTAATRLRWLVPAALFLAGMSWWHVYDGPGPSGSDHTIGIGLFMVPHPDAPQWLHDLAVPIYAGIFPLVFAVTAVTTLGVLRKRATIAPPPDSALWPVAAPG